MLLKQNHALLDQEFRDFYTNKTILITGIRGALARACVEIIQQLNNQQKLNIKIIGTSRNKAKAEEIFKNTDITILENDLLSPLLTNEKCDVVFHFASPLDNIAKNQGSEIIHHTETIINFIKNYNIQNIIFTSTQAVYRGLNCPKNGYRENMKLVPDKNKSYVYGKQNAEDLFQKSLNKEKYNLIIGRIFTLMGKYLATGKGMAFPDFITEYKNRFEINMLGDGTPVRSYISTHDAGMMMMLLLAKKTKTKIYNIGSENHMNFFDLAKIITCDENKIKTKKTAKNHKVNNSYPNMDKANQILSAFKFETVTDIVLKMKDNIKISVVIPTYNRQEYLKRAINSVLEQTYDNIEICVTDNHSDDGTQALCEHYVKKYGIKYNRNNENLGFAKNIYHGVHKMATGDYVVYISDDDYFVDNYYFEDAVKHIQEKQPAFIYGRFIMETVAQGKVIKTNPDNKNLKGNWNEPYYNIAGNTVVQNYHSSDYPHININCLIMRRDYCIQYDAFIGNYMAVDQQAKIKVALQGDGIFLNRVVLHYTFHEKNETFAWNFNDNCRDIYNLIDDVTPYLQKHYDRKSVKRIQCQYKLINLSNAPRILKMFGFKKTLLFIYRVSPKNFLGIKTLIKLTWRYIMEKWAYR